MRATAKLILACAIAAAPARASDGVVEVAIGGLTLTGTDAVRQQGSLHLGQIVRVNFRFTNTTDLPIDALVAFPLPDIPPDLYIATATTSEPIWETLNFTTSVDGRPLASKLVEQAFFKGEA